MSASLQHNFNQDDLLFAQPECLRPSDTRMAKVFDARKQQQALAMRVTAEARLRDAAGTAAGLYHCGEQVLHPGKCQGALKIQSEESVALVWCSCCKQLLDSTDKNKRFYEQLNSANAALPLDYVLLHSFEDETFVLCDWAGPGALKVGRQLSRVKPPQKPSLLEARQMDEGEKIHELLVNKKRCAEGHEDPSNKRAKEQ